MFYHSSILLGTKGFDVPRLSEKLDRLDTAKTFEPLEPVRETDIQVLVVVRCSSGHFTIVVWTGLLSHPSRSSNLASYFPLQTLAFEIPLPPKFPATVLLVHRYGYFLVPPISLEGKSPWAVWLKAVKFLSGFSSKWEGKCYLSCYRGSSKKCKFQ